MCRTAESLCCKTETNKTQYWSTTPELKFKKKKKTEKNDHILRCTLYPQYSEAEVNGKEIK